MRFHRSGFRFRWNLSMMDPCQTVILHLEDLRANIYANTTGNASSLVKCCFHKLLPFRQLWLSLGEYYRQVHFKAFLREQGVGNAGGHDDGFTLG